jgi:hypothetical protein
MSLQNPVFASYVVAVTLMILKAVSMPSMRRLAIDGLNPTGGFRACKWSRREAAMGRVRPVATGCFPAAHLQGLLCGDELGRGSVIFRPELTRAR